MLIYFYALFIVAAAVGTVVAIRYHNWLVILLAFVCAMAALFLGTRIGF